MPSATSWYHLADCQRLPMAILRHVLSESDQLVNEEITVEVLSRETALVEMVKSRAGSCPSRITTVGHDVLALHGTRGIQIAEKSSMDIDDFPSVFGVSLR